MNTRSFRKLGLMTMILILLRAALCAQDMTSTASPAVVVPYRDDSDPDAAGDIIFSNLTPSPDNLYNTNPDLALSIAGKDAYNNVTEEWFAVQFTPDVDARAKVLIAAVGYISGAKRLTLSICNNDRATQSVGRPVQGAEVSTSQIPDLGSCCQLVKVKLPGDGIHLAAHKRYWLVVKSDDVNAPTFYGGWYRSNLAKSAYYTLLTGWMYPSGDWPAAEIRGTRMQQASSAAQPFKATRATPPVSDGESSNQITIFTNLGPTPTNLYNSYAGGVYVAGNAAFDTSEVWEALPFTAKTNCHAKTIAVAIGYNSGTKKVNLGIYEDNDGAVGTLLPGGQGTTTEIPDFGQCCGLAQVTLPGAGPALASGSHYWLVASPDNLNAPDFEGLWQASNLAFGAYTQPENLTNWATFTGVWLAAEISGTSP